MLDFLLNLGTSFVLGLLTPLTAVCVLPLYPGFLAYLAKQVSGEEEASRKTIIWLSLVITGGVILFMFILGLVFTTILQVSLTKVIGIVSPIAFGILIIISISLILNVDFSKLLPKYKYKTKRNPYWSALTYGFFFGAIVIPCNPLFIAALFSRTLVSSDFLLNFLNFIFFGVGIGAPLIVFGIISAAVGQRIINFFVKHQRIINLIAGILMLGISLYYLIFVFRVLDFIR